MDAATAYFLKKYYPHVIKWWLVLYNPEKVRIWPSKKEKEDALRLEAEEAKLLTIEGSDKKTDTYKTNTKTPIDNSAYNATTGSYSGLYGRRPVDSQTQETLDAILSTSSNQSTVDSLLSGSTTIPYPVSGDIITPPEQEEIIQEANTIYERLLREAEEDEAKKQAEIEKARHTYDELR